MVAWYNYDGGKWIDTRMRDRALINQKLNGRMEKGGSYDTRRPLYRSAPA